MAFDKNIGLDDSFGCVIDIEKGQMSESLQSKESSMIESHPGLSFDVAADARQVTDAWGLVYRAYLSAGLIHANHAKLHTVAQAIQPNTAVILGRIGEMPVSTISAYIDGPKGLPLDAVYHDELEALRQSGRRLTEFGLFADRRQHLFRSIDALLELIRYATYFALSCDATDGVIGVHPHHANFYTRLIGFEPAGEVKEYETVKNNPVALLRIDWAKVKSMEKLPRGMRYLTANVIEPKTFDSRFRFDQSDMEGTAIERFFLDQPEPINTVSSA